MASFVSNFVLFGGWFFCCSFFSSGFLFLFLKDCLPDDFLMNENPSAKIILVLVRNNTPFMGSTPYNKEQSDLNVNEDFGLKGFCTKVTVI